MVRTTMAAGALLLAGAVLTTTGVQAQGYGAYEKERRYEASQYYKNRSHAVAESRKREAHAASQYYKRRAHYAAERRKYGGYGYYR